MKKRLKSFMISVVLTTAAAHAGNFNYYPAYYRPRFFFGEPRLANKGLTSLYGFMRGGHAMDGYTCTGQQANVLNIYGRENLSVLTKGVPSALLNRNPDCIANTVWHYEASQHTFGQLTINGKFSIAEFLPVITQNIAKGFFVTITVPIKCTSIKELYYIDNSTPSSFNQSISRIDWQVFINTIEQNMCRYGTHLGPSKSHGLGDIQLLGGWTINYEDLSTIDFIDFSALVGVNIPTSTVCPYTVFYLPLGYEGHTGIPLIIDASVGIFDWFTLGIQTGALWFNTKKRIMAMKTDSEQNGWIKLAHDAAHVKKGTIWHIDEYLKFDHLIEGFSLYVGFSHDHANRTWTTPCDTATFDYAIVNNDAQLLPWTLNAAHVVLELDWASFKHPNAPRVAFTVDKTFSGKRAFETLLFGAYLGVDCSWDF